MNKYRYFYEVFVKMPFANRGTYCRSMCPCFCECVVFRDAFFFFGRCLRPALLRYKKGLQEEGLFFRSNMIAGKLFFLLLICSCNHVRIPLRGLTIANASPAGGKRRVRISPALTSKACTRLKLLPSLSLLSLT